MPTLGKVHCPAFLIEFPDYDRTQIPNWFTKENVQNILNDGLPQDFPMDSVRGYYQRASYSKLDIQTDVYGWYMAQKPRDQYKGADELLREILATYDSQVDFSVYDADNDGVLDAIHMLYISDKEDRSSMWISAVFSGPGFAADGVKIPSVSFINLLHGSWELRDACEIIIHETGHFLGLPDYYDTAGNLFTLEGGMNSFDMMLNNAGDMNAFSKFMLGWMDNVQIVSSGEQVLTLRSVSEYGDMAIVYPQYAGPLSDYFVVEYITRTGNNTKVTATDPFTKDQAGGVRILRVSADEGKNGLFKYGNYQGSAVKLLESVKKGIWDWSDDPLNPFCVKLFRQGEAFTPYTFPSSYHKNSKGKASATGVCITDFAFDEQNNTVTFKASIEPATKVDIAIQPLTRFENFTTLRANVEVTYAGKAVPYLLDGKKKIPLKVFTVSGSAQENEIYLTYEDNVKTKLQMGKTYTLVIPKGALKSKTGVLSKEIRIDVPVFIPNSSTTVKDLMPGYKQHAYVPVDKETAALFYAQGFGSIEYKCKTISSNGKVSGETSLLSFNNADSLNIVGLAGGRALLVTYSYAMNEVYLDLVDSQGTRLYNTSMPIAAGICAAQPFASGALIRLVTTSGLETYFLDLQNEPVRIDESVGSLLPTGNISSTFDQPNVFDIGQGQWLAVDRERGHSLAILSEDLTIEMEKKFFTDNAELSTERPIGAARLADGNIGVLMVQWLNASYNGDFIQAADSKVILAIFDSQLNRIDTKTVVDKAANLYFQSCIELAEFKPVAGGYTFSLQFSMTPERQNHSPITCTYVTDEAFNLRFGYWRAASGKGSYANLVELSQNTYLIGSWDNATILEPENPQ